MLRIPISSEDIVVIERERYYHPQPHIMITLTIFVRRSTIFTNFCLF